MSARIDYGAATVMAVVARRWWGSAPSVLHMARIRSSRTDHWNGGVVSGRSEVVGSGRGITMVVAILRDVVRQERKRVKEEGSDLLYRVGF